MIRARRSILAAVAVATALIGALTVAGAPAQAAVDCSKPNPPKICFPTTVSSSPTMYVDGNQQAATLDGVRVYGWAADQDQPHTQLEIEFTVDGVFAGTTIAGGDRPDVANVFPDYGAYHGYSVTLPASNGDHTVCVTAVSVGGGPDTTQCSTMDRLLVFVATSIVYQLPIAEVSDTGVDQIGQVTAPNPTDSPLSKAVSGSKTVTDTESWVNSGPPGIAFDASFTVDVPAISDGILVQTQGKPGLLLSSATASKTFSWQQTLAEPPHTTATDTVTLTHSTITAPYSLYGYLRYLSGATVNWGLGNGVFTGTVHYGLTVTTTQTPLS